MCPARNTGKGKRGYIIPIGGAEEKDDKPVILQKFFELCGGSAAKIIVIPTASKLGRIGSQYMEIFDELGAAHVDYIKVKARDDCSREATLNKLDKATGIFITGGNQLRLSTILGGTPLAKKLRYLNAHGIHIAGTSAGAAIIPEHMIAGGSTGPTPSESGVVLSPGLGLTNAIMIDQHFRERDRLGRLLTALAYNPFACGMGIDEDTAVFIDPDDMLEVVGSGAVTVVDPGELKYSSIGEARRGETISLINARLHILTSGSKYNIATREPFIKLEEE